MSSPLWDELGASMRRLRRERGVSLRQAEVLSGRTRGMLSQAENGKARPSRELVEWYDAKFGADGFLVTAYVEARALGNPQSRVRPAREPRPPQSTANVPLDEMRVVSSEPPAGHIVAVGDRLNLRWILSNAGQVPWRDRRLQRIGSVGGVRLLTSAPSVVVPDAEPQAQVEVSCPVLAPDVVGTVIAYWQMVDGAGNPYFPDERPISAIVVVA